MSRLSVVAAAAALLLVAVVALTDAAPAVPAGSILRWTTVYGCKNKADASKLAALENTVSKACAAHFAEGVSFFEGADSTETSDACYIKILDFSSWANLDNYNGCTKDVPERKAAGELSSFKHRCPLHTKGSLKTSTFLHFSGGNATMARAASSAGASLLAPVSCLFNSFDAQPSVVDPSVSSPLSLGEIVSMKGPNSAAAFAAYKLGNGKAGALPAYTTYSRLLTAGSVKTVQGKTILIK